MPVHRIAPLSSPAKAGDPVNAGLSRKTATVAYRLLARRSKSHRFASLQIRFAARPNGAQRIARDV